MRKFALIGALAIALLGISPAVTNAAMLLRLTDNFGNTVTVSDQQLGVDLSPVVGVITFTGTLTGGSSASPWIVNVTTGLSKPAIGSPSQAKIDLSSVNVSSTGVAGSTITLEVTDTDYTLSGSPIAHYHNIGGTLSAGGSISSADYLDLGNAEFGLSNGLFLGPFTAAGGFSGGISGSVAGYVPGAGFSMTEVVIITHGSGVSSTSFNSESIASVPEPATALILLGLAPVLGFVARRRRTVA